MIQPISILSISSISSLGNTSEEIWKNYLTNSHQIQLKSIEGVRDFVSELGKKSKEHIAYLKNSDTKYKKLDDSVLFALFASRQAVKKANWQGVSDFGINIGSSRGATGLFENYHSEFLKTGKTGTLSSPTTTLGNISSWIAHDLQTDGPQLSHSITCSTALHALLNGIAWIQSGLAGQFLVGGSEAPLTAFTIAQMKALKIYANQPSEFPCRALDLSKKRNSMVLGEGASVICLEKGEKKNAIATIVGIGYATELLAHNISISDKGTCFQKAMKMAMNGIKKDEVDAIVMHAPGTVKGDVSEYNAIKEVFDLQIPALTSNKWKLGHTLGASGMLSVEFAIFMLQHQKFISVPFANEGSAPKQLKKILINAVGFGGNAVSILISK